ncbi:MAG: PAS domain S-box protein [Blastocatellia bacterium]|nr:PAS domain S-box protein [Blastocatellia bacterium]
MSSTPDPAAGPEFEIEHLRRRVAELENRLVEQETISAQSILAETELVVQQVLANSPDSILMLNPEGKILFLNQCSADLLGIGEGKSPARTWGEYWQGDEQELAAHALEAAQEGLPARFQGFFPAAAGPAKYKDVILTPISEADGRIRKILVIARDISEIKDYEDRLTRNERYYRALVENATDLVLVVNQEGLVLYASPSLIRLTGYCEAELLGRNAFGFGHPEEIPRMQGLFRAALTSGSTGYSLVEYRWRSKDGSWRYYEGIARNLLDDPAVRGLVLNSRDVTERKEGERLLRENEERYRLLFEAIPCPVYVYDLETLRFLAVNTTAVLEYGYAQEEFLSMTILEIRPPEDIPVFLELLNQPLHGQKRISVRHRKKTGALMEVEVSLYDLVYQGRPARYVVVNDVTERNARESLIVAQKQELEEANLKLQELDRVKADFTAMLAHDLKSPLTVVKATLDFLEMERAMIPGHLADFVGTSQRSLTNVIGLVNDMLEVFKTDRQDINLHLEPLEFSLFLHNLTKEAAIAAKAKNISFVVDILPDLPWICGDQDQLHRVFSNLLSNSLKFTPAGGSLRLDARRTTRTGVEAGLSFIVVAITDTGPGIPADQLPYVFEPYQQAQSGYRKVGVGLGLAIVKRLVAAHGGHITVRSQIGVGTTFWVTLPAIEQIEPVVVPEAPHPVAEVDRGAVLPGVTQHPVRILLVEDNLVNQKVIASHLKKLGLAAVICGTGQEALQAIDREPYDLILMDYHLPDQDGLSVTRAIRQSERNRPPVTGYPSHTAIVALTGSSSDEAANFLAAGMDDFLEKPIDAAKFKACLMKWLTRVPWESRSTSR